MAVRVDAVGLPRGGRRWHHLAADTEDELHAFAAALGLRRSWFHAGSRHAHYDVTDVQRERALRLGAVASSARDIVRASARGAASRGK